MKLNQMREQKQNNELDECTFQPYILPNKNYDNSYSQLQHWNEHIDQAYEYTNKPRDSSFSIGNLKSSDNYSRHYENYDQYNSRYQ